MQLSEDYIVTKFYQYAGYPKYNRLTKSYNGGCPTCREGQSWGKKRRLYYIPKKNLIFCHNCGISLRPGKWLQQVSGMNYGEILKENSNFSNTDIIEPVVDQPVLPVDELPKDAINLLDSTQVNYFKKTPIVAKALELIKKRRLDTAINRPKTLWLSTKDPVHKNRLVIPFYNNLGKIEHYQTRTILEQSDKQYPKYLSKQNSEKTLFGIDRIDQEQKHIFITEGPIDAFFIKNCVAVAGINESSKSTFTKKQETQLKEFPLQEIIWVLDNQYVDTASRKKTLHLLKQGFKIFLWPKELKKYKDINELCIATKIDEIGPNFILKNTVSGMKGVLTVTQT